MGRGEVPSPECQRIKGFRQRHSGVISGPGPFKTAFETPVYPGDDQGHIERQGEKKKSHRIEQRMIAKLRDRFLDLVDRHDHRQQLVASEMRWDLDHAADIGPIARGRRQIRGRPSSNISSDSKTGQITRYKIRTDHESATVRSPPLAEDEARAPCCSVAATNT